MEDVTKGKMSLHMSPTHLQVMSHTLKIPTERRLLSTGLGDHNVTAKTTQVRALRTLLLLNMQAYSTKVCPVTEAMFTGHGDQTTKSGTFLHQRNSGGHEIFPVGMILQEEMRPVTLRIQVKVDLKTCLGHGDRESGTAAIPTHSRGTALAPQTLVTTARLATGPLASPALSTCIITQVPELDDDRLADASVVVARAEGMYFIQRLFQRYTSKQGNRGHLSASDLAALLRNILFRGATEKPEATHVHLDSSAKPPLYRPQGDLGGVYHGLHEEHSHCLSAQQLLEAFHYETGEELDYRRFMYLCPAVLYQLDSSLCAPHSHGPEGTQVHSEHAANTSHTHAPTSDGTFEWKRWLVAVGSVLVISVVGLGCVLAVQQVRSSVRHFLLPFLVALAVGALSGDALLHLLPHALASEHTDGGGDHKAGVWKGLTALTGMLAFWILENVFRLCQRRKTRRRHTKDPLGVRAADLERSKSHSTEMAVREEEVMLQIKSNLPDKNIAETDYVVKDGHSGPETDDDHHHHHAHAHGHAHSVPEGMAAILSMVVLGDGIHNLLDGLAIGAAFTAGLTSGLSTALAVLCHELPHEIGDFAMLLSAGMPVRRALLFNCVSSVLCVLGCLVGLAVGDTASLTLWLLSAVAGLFLFLAFVTMLPQLREERGAESSRGFLLRASGVLLGAGIMLVIAVFEEELKSLLEV